MFERPPVDAAARTLLATAGYTDRIDVITGDMFDDPQPSGHDVHLDADKRRPLPVAEYSALLMHSTPGKCWSTGELAEMATTVGFVDVEHCVTAGDRSIVLARKPL